MEGLTLDEIISYAKIAEDNAKSFYLHAANHANLRNVKEYLESLAEEEQGHLDHLEKLQKKIHKKGRVPPLHKEVQTLGYAEALKPPRLDEDATYKDVLEVAILQEKHAIENYQRFARSVDDDDARKLFELLAQEERDHLRRFEEEYDDYSNQYY